MVLFFLGQYLSEIRHIPVGIMQRVHANAEVVNKATLYRCGLFGQRFCNLND